MGQIDDYVIVMRWRQGVIAEWQ